MSLRQQCLCVTVLTALSGHAIAQDGFRDAERASRDLRFEQRTPFAGLSEAAALRRDWSVNTFYTVFRGQHPRQTVFWVVRRVAGGPNQAETVLWADSRTCSGVERALIEMERMPAVTPDAPRLGPERNGDEIVITADGTAHIFWNRPARAGPNNATVGLEITGNTNSPIAMWWAQASEDLERCWRDTPPE